MKKILTFAILLSSIFIASCSSDDDNSNGNNYPQTLNIKYEITTTLNRESIINQTLNNNTETFITSSFPYSHTYAQQEVNQGTYLKLSYQDDDVVLIGTGSGSSWVDYEAELKIFVNNNIVKAETFTIEEATGTVEIDYTFE